MPLYFNPRPLAGATGENGHPLSDKLISIHAPLRGRLIFIASIEIFIKFQSTPPCGGDMINYLVSTPLLDFNPRPLAGATRTASATFDSLIISIHAPLRGRHIHKDTFLMNINFNPRPLAGATVDSWVANGLSPISIHAPLRGRHQPDLLFFISF